MLPDLSGDMRWRKASASGGEGGECIELAYVGAVRDSKNPNGPALAVDVPALVTAVKAMRASGPR